MNFAWSPWVEAGRQIVHQLSELPNESQGLMMKGRQ